MQLFLALYLWLLAVLVIIMMFRQHIKGTCELLSIRNVALTGFVLFQLTSAALALTTQGHTVFRPQNPVGTGLMYTAMATVFLILFLWSYREGWSIQTLVRKIPTTWATPNDAGLLTIAAVITVVSASIRFGVKIPIVAIGSHTLSIGLAALSSGLIGWVWSRRLLNPAMITISILVVTADFGIVMAEAFGRRGVVAVGGALVWGMYYASWRSLPIRLLVARLALVSIGPIIVVALFTSVRGPELKDKSAQEQAQAMTSYGSVARGIIDLAAGQGVGGVSMWIIESYPDAIEYQHLMTLRHFIVYPVPRAWWPDKPTGLGQKIPTLARQQRVNRKSLSIATGIIGHAEADGGWYALILYAILFGLYIRFFDEMLTQNINSPFIVLSVGCALGHILGLFRGETSAFAFLALMTVTGVLIFMVCAGKVLEIFGGKTVDSEELYEHEGDDDYYFDQPHELDDSVPSVESHSVR